MINAVGEISVHCDKIMAEKSTQRVLAATKEEKVFDASSVQRTWQMGWSGQWPTLLGGNDPDAFGWTSHVFVIYLFERGYCDLWDCDFETALSILLAMCGLLKLAASSNNQHNFC